MSINIPNPIPLFHITSISNLEKIIESGGLLSKATLDSNRHEYCDIAYSHIQSRRNNVSVPLGKGGTLTDYVPLSFAPRPPMLDAIRRGNVVTCNEPQENILHLVTYAQTLDEAQVPYVYTSGHAIMQPIEFFDSLNDIDKVDWEILLELPQIGGYAKYWNDKEDVLRPKWIDRARRRQAEFLVHEKLPWHLIKGIATMTEEKKLEVETILQRFNLGTAVISKPTWYYT